MAVSKKEMSEFMGLAYVPFTFPTVEVKNNMVASRVPVSNGEVDMLWGAYFQGTTEAGLAPFGGSQGDGKANSEILNYIANKTNLGKMKAAAFLNALFKAVQDGRDIQYLNPAGKIAEQEGHYSLNPIESVKTLASDIGTTAKNLILPVADPVTNILKYTALAVVAGALVYGMFQFGPVIKAKFKQSKKRKRA